VSKALMQHAGASLDATIGTGDRLTRDQKAEIDRMLSTAAYTLFANGQQAKILDTDFYTFVGATVRTPKNAFIGRMMATENAVSEAKRLNLDRSDDLADVLDFLKATFKDLIARRQEGKSGY